MSADFTAAELRDREYLIGYAWSDGHERSRAFERLAAADEWREYRARRLAEVVRNLPSPHALASPLAIYQTAWEQWAAARYVCDQGDAATAALAALDADEAAAHEQAQR